MITLLDRKGLETFECKLKVSITDNRADEHRPNTSCRFTCPVRNPSPSRRRGRDSMPEIMKNFTFLRNCRQLETSQAPSSSFSSSTLSARNIVSSRRDGLYVLAAPLSAPSIGNSFPFASSRGVEKRAKEGKDRGGLRGKWFH